jgi:hypothetical protein
VLVAMKRLKKNKKQWQGLVTMKKRERVRMKKVRSKSKRIRI